jgi:hypothetical protein
VNLYRKAIKNASVQRVAIILSVRGSRKIDEMAPLPLVVKCLRLLRRGEVGKLILPFHEAEVVLQHERRFALYTMIGIT